MGCMEPVEDQFDICPHCGYVRGTGIQAAYYLEPGTIQQKRYLLGRVLGCGGFGVTYIGYDTNLQRKVAVVESVSVGYYFSAAVKTDGSLWMWGANEYGQLGEQRQQTYL